MSRTGPGELLVVLVDVGEHMRPYLPTLHRMLFDTLNSKLFNKPRDEVALVLYGTKGTRHALYDESDPDSTFPHVTVLRELEAVGSTAALEPFAFASDPPGAAEGEGGQGVDLDALVDAGGRLDSDPQEALAARAARLLGPSGPRADWGDALTVAMDLLARALNERFAGAKKPPPARILLVSNLLARSEPMEDDFRQEMAEGCNAKGITLDVACLDHVPPAAAATNASVPSQPSQLPPELAGQRRANLESLHMLKAAMAPSMFRHLRQPGELLCLCRAVERTPNAAFVGSLVLVEPQQGAEGEEGAPGLELPVKVHKKTQKATKPSWKNYHAQEPHAADFMQDGEGVEDGPRQLIRDTQYKGPDGEVVPVESLAKALEYGKQLVPVTELEEAALRAPLEDKALKVVGFVARERIMRHQFMKDVHVIVGNSDHAHLGLSALARAMAERNVVGIVRAKLRRGMTLFMGALTPALGSGSAVPDVLLLNVLPWAEDLRLHAFTTFRNEAEAADLLVQKEELAAQMRADRAAAASGTAGTAPSQAGSAANGSGSNASASGAAPMVYEKLQPTPEQLDAAIALVQQLDLGPGPGGPGGRVAEEALAPEATCNPLLHRMQAFISSKALDAHAQLPPEDELAQLVLEPRSALSYMGPEAAAALRRAEGLLAVQERTELAQAPVAEAAAADGETADGAAAATSGGAAGGAAATAVVFDPSAAGGAATRVTRVSTANAEEDFKAMVAQGGESAAAAVAQMCDEVLPKLVSYSIGEQQYGKIAQCVDLLRTTCAKGGRASAFNAFLPQLLDLCKRTERDALLQLLVATRGVTLISSQEAEAAGGGVEGAVSRQEAEEFLRRYREAGGQGGAAGAGAAAGTGAGAGAGAAQVVVVEDDDFGDME